MEKKVVKIDGLVDNIDNAEEIKNEIKIVIKEQKQIRNLIYFFILAIFLLFVAYIFFRT